MYNLLATLLLVSGTYMISTQSSINNQLYHFGILLLFAHVFGTAADRIRLPRFFGYVFAGMLAGSGGVGFINERFPESIEGIYFLFIMILLAKIGSRLADTTPSTALRNLASGIVAVAGVFVIVFIFMKLLDVPVITSVIMSLFAATASPLFIESVYGDRADTRLTYMAVGGLLFIVMCWGAAIAIAGPPHPDRLRLATMPMVIGITSGLTGYAIGFVAYVCCARLPLRFRQAYLAGVLFLTYPLITAFGLDFLFLALGFGLFHGILSPETYTLPTTELVPLVIFSIFGLSLPLADMTLLDHSEWKLVAALSISLLIGRTLTYWTIAQAGKNTDTSISTISFIGYGPFAIILPLRFLPGFAHAMSGTMDQFGMLRICTSAVIITLIVSACISGIGSILKSWALWRGQESKEMQVFS